MRGIIVWVTWVLIYDKGIKRKKKQRKEAEEENSFKGSIQVQICLELAESICGIGMVSLQDMGTLCILIKRVILSDLHSIFYFNNKDDVEDT